LINCLSNYTKLTFLKTCMTFFDMKIIGEALAVNFIELKK
jgi:hypothetical protein